MPNGLRIEHLGDIISKAQSLLVLNLPVFMFVYIHFNVPPTRITDLFRNVSDEKFSWYGTFPLSAGMFCFYQLDLCSVSYTPNEYSIIYLFCIIMKDFFISFSRVIVVQDFETVTFYVLFVYKPIFSVLFCWIKRVRVSGKFNSLFILYISTAKPISLVRGYIEVKISKHDIW